jgi:hypothetical protein
MPRRNIGPKLHFRKDRGSFYIVERIRGRKCQYATGTADGEEAKAIFAEWITGRRKPATGASDPAQILVADILTVYAQERGPNVVGRETLANAITWLADSFNGKTVAEAPGHVAAYLRRRNKAAGTMRRELGVLQTAINYAHQKGRLTRAVAIELPEAPASPAPNYPYNLVICRCASRRCGFATAVAHHRVITNKSICDTGWLGHSKRLSSFTILMLACAALRSRPYRLIQSLNLKHLWCLLG